MIGEVEFETLEVRAPKSQRDTLPPWDRNPFALVSRWDMAKFDGSTFCLICSHLRGLGDRWMKDRDEVIGDKRFEDLKSDLEFVRSHCREAGLDNAVAFISDNVGLLAPNVNYDYVWGLFGNLPFQIRSEMKRVEFLRVDKPEFYGSASLFDGFVTDVYPELTYDIVEAGNCLALDRTTACVFHLMRIMEFGVQKLGSKLDVPLVNESVWQKIMDQVNSRIAAMPERPAIKKRIKERYAEIAGHLYHVKVAWRNPVMHPKRTYTPEEAEQLFNSVKMFMEVLVTFLKPNSVKKSKAGEDWLAELEGTSPSPAVKALYGIKGKE